MRLGAQQLNHFETFGFLVFRQLLSPEEMERFSEEFDSGMAACWRTRSSTIPTGSMAPPGPCASSPARTANPCTAWS